MITLTLHGVPVYCSGVAGHFIGPDCVFRMLHTVAGRFQVSTCGMSRNPEGGYFRIGPSRYLGETIVNVVSVCSEHMPNGDSDPCAPPIFCAHYRDPNSVLMERGHLAILDAICRAIADNKGSDEEIAAAVNSLKL